MDATLSRGTVSIVIYTWDRGQWCIASGLSLVLCFKPQGSLESVSDAGP